MDAFDGVGAVLRREVGSRELTDHYLERIERLDPHLNAYRSVYWERARQEADQADARARAGDQRPLLGVPVAIKDDIDVAGDFTGHGSEAHGPAAAADAEVVRRLRSAGAVILGKTHVPELTIMPFTESSTYGVTRNPWDPGRTSGGSSRRVGGPRSRPAWRRSPSAPTAPARSGSRPASAGCSA